MEQYLSDLNEQQRDAVVFVDAPSLVIAGAGSGKTRVLTRKIVHLLRLGCPLRPFWLLHSQTRPRARCATVSNHL